MCMLVEVPAPSIAVNPANLSLLEGLLRRLNTEEGYLNYVEDTASL